MPIFKTAVYKTVGDAELTLSYVLPDGSSPSPCPAVLFYFGGGFKNGKVEQFRPQSEYLAERGIAGIAADYRVKSRHGVTPSDCVRDALDAYAWVYGNAAAYGIAADRIAVAGGSAGGYLAGAVALLPGFGGREPVRRPPAVAMFNPLLDTYCGDAALACVPDDERETLNLMDKIRPGLPPMTIFQGEVDQGTPLTAAQRFADGMRAAGNRCDLHVYAGEDHGFFNKGQGTLPDDGCYWDTVRKLHEFLSFV